MAVISDRLNEADNAEVIRDQIAAIIVDEMQNQYDLAVEDEDPVADDYDVTVLIENDEPLSANGSSDLYPLVDVMMDGVANDGGDSVNNTIRTASFNIDCYQIGNTSGKFAGRAAMIKAWKLARCVRRILEADYYTYLVMRGVVSQTKITNMSGGYPSGMENAAVKVCAVRIKFEVKYDEAAPRTTGPGFELMPVVITDSEGVTVVDIE